MSVTQNLKTVVTLGGAVDSSFSGMAGTVDKQLGKATKQVKDLEREQKKLTKQIKKGKLAGKDVSRLTRRYQALGGEITEAARAAEGFEAASSFGEGISTATKRATAATGAVFGLTSAVTGLMTITNAQTAEQMGLAQAYGMSIEQFNAWGGLAKQAGLDAEATGDLVEELSNKFGEFKALGEQSTVSEVFDKLGIDAAMMDGLSAAEQFEFIMRRLEKVGDTQQAASLADMLFGGEGNKIVSYIKNSGKGIDDLLHKQREINHLTSAGATGAHQYNTAWTNLTTSVTSAWQEVAGVVGGEVAPIFDDLGQSISRYVRENKAELVAMLKGTVQAAISLAGAVVSVGAAVNSTVEAFGGWEVVGAAVAGVVAGKIVVGVASLVGTISTMISALSTAKTVMLGLSAVMAASPIGAVAAVVGLLVAGFVALYQNWDDIKERFAPFFDWMSAKWQTVIGWVKKGGEALKSVASFFGFGDDEDVSPKARAPQPYGQYSQRQSTGYGYGVAAQARALESQPVQSAGKGNTVHQRVEKIEIVTQPGQSNQEIGRAVAAELSGAHDGAMYDMAWGD